MLSVELKFTIHALLKWFDNICKSRFVEIDKLTKQKYEKNHPIDWPQTKCIICDFKMPAGSFFGPLSEQMNFYDFVVKKERLLLGKIFDEVDLRNSNTITGIKIYCKNFKRSI